MCDIDFDGETWKVWKQRPIARTRKDFRCDGCGVSLPRGSTCFELSYLYEGKWTADRACFACWWTLATFGDAHAVVIAPAQLWEMLENCVIDNGDHDDEWRPHLAGIKRRYRMTAAGRKQLAERIEHHRRFRGRTSWLHPHGQWELTS